MSTDAKCGGDNCMGRRVDGVKRWVTVAARDAAVAAERESHERALAVALADARMVERERCARVCMAVHADTGECPEMALYCADRIRAKPEQT